QRAGTPGPAPRRRCAGRCTSGRARGPRRTGRRSRSRSALRRRRSLPGTGCGRSSGKDWDSSTDSSETVAKIAKTPAPGPGFSLAARTPELLGGRLRPVDELDVGHRCIVAVAEPALDDAQVAARTLAVT